MKNFLFFIILSSLSISLNAQYITVYTRFGEGVQGILRSEELTANEVQILDSTYTTNFPNATFLDHSSTTYNCHSFAWNMTNGGTTCWINAGTNNSNISKYWTGDYYVSCSSSSAVKIHYYNSDHSAITSSVSGMYESKWGSAPLMRHAPAYGPYINMGNRNYFNVRTYQMSGPGEVIVGDNNNYVVSLPFYGMYCVWDVTNGKGEQDGFIQNISGNVNTINFQKTGIFEVYSYIYSQNDNCVGTTWIEVLVYI
jgi:hypothetical protein